MISPSIFGLNMTGLSMYNQCVTATLIKKPEILDETLVTVTLESWNTSYIVLDYQLSNLVDKRSLFNTSW